MNPNTFNAKRLARLGWTVELATKRATESIKTARQAKREGWNPSFVCIATNEFVRCRRIARLLRAAA